MNNLKIFKNEMFGTVRTMTSKKGEILFVGKDVAQALGYSNTRKALIDHVENEDRDDGVTIRDAIGRKQKAVFINESGLSKNESAPKTYRDWPQTQRDLPRF